MFLSFEFEDQIILFLVVMTRTVSYIAELLYVQTLETCYKYYSPLPTQYTLLEITHIENTFFVHVLFACLGFLIAHLNKLPSILIYSVAVLDLQCVIHSMHKRLQKSGGA